MAKTYSYNPANIADNGVDRMRFELGDTSVDGGEETCALCDEEYQAIIDSSDKGFEYAKYKCLKAIVMKLSYEVDFSADGMSVSLSQRFPRWKEMFDKEDQKYKYVNVAPSFLGGNSISGKHEFYTGMNDNIRALTMLPR